MKINYKWLLSEEGKQAYDLLDNVMDWDFSDEHTIMHKPTGLALWIGNGAWFFRGYNHRHQNYKCDLPAFEFGLRDKFFLWRKYTKARSMQRLMLIVGGAGA